MSYRSSFIPHSFVRTACCIEKTDAWMRFTEKQNSVQSIIELRVKINYLLVKNLY